MTVTDNVSMAFIDKAKVVDKLREYSKDCVIPMTEEYSRGYKVFENFDKIIDGLNTFYNVINKQLTTAVEAKDYSRAAELKNYLDGYEQALVFFNITLEEIKEQK